MYKYSEIYEELRNKIVSGQYKHGEKIPSENEFCRLYGYSRVTVHSALSKLQQRGFIVRRVGDASYVSYEPEPGQKPALTVALILTMYIPELIDAVRKELAKHGVNLTVYITNYSAEEERRVLVKVLAAPVDAVICYPTLYPESLDILDKLIYREFPIVFLDRHPNSAICSAVFDNGYLNMFRLTEKLISMGYESIGYVSLPLHSFQPMTDRYNGFYDALTKYGIRIDQINLAILQSSELSYQGKDLLPIFSHLINSKKRPDVVLCSTGILAAELYRFVSSCGIRVPEDLSIVSHDSCAVSHMCSVVQDYVAIGFEAAGLIISQLIFHKKTAVKVYVPGAFFEGSTLLPAQKNRT